MQIQLGGRCENIKNEEMGVGTQKRNGREGGKGCEKKGTFSIGRVKQAAMTAARRRRRRVILRAEDQEKAMVNLRRQGLHSSSSSFKSGEGCFNRALNPPRFARVVEFPFFFNF